MQDLAKLNDLAAAEIDALQAEGITPTPAEIVELNAIGWAIECPESRRQLARGIPVTIGNVRLWPLTLYGQEWFNRVGLAMCSVKEQTCALAFAMAHSRDDGDPLAFDGKEAEKAVVRWASRLKCTPGELNVAIAQILQQDEEHEQPPSIGDGMGAGELSAHLAAATGGDPDFWERRCAASYAYAVLHAIVEQNKADDRATMSDPRIRAERAMGWAIERIRKSRASNVE